MKCMTLNIWNFQRSWTRRRQIIAALIRDHQPDVVALQETRHDIRFQWGQGQAEQIALLTNYHQTWIVGQVYFPFPRVDEGLTILTRTPPLRIMMRRLTRTRRLRGDGNQRVCLGVALATEGGEFHYYNTHFSLNPRARELNALEVMRFIREHSGNLPSVVVGDLNTGPDTPPIRFLVGDHELEGEAGDFTDCWPAVHPGEPGYSYASWHPVRRIDFMLARNLLQPPVSVELVGDRAVDGVYASDHIGILAEFAL